MLNIDLAPIKDPSFIWTLQIKLSNFDRSSPSIKMGLYIIYPINKEIGLPSLISVKSMVIFLKIHYYFYTKYKFSEAYVSPIIDLGPIKYPSFVDFADQTEQLWQIYSPFPRVTAVWQPTNLISGRSMAYA